MANQPTGPLAPAEPLPRWKWSHRLAVAVLVIAVAVVVAVAALGGPDLLGPPDTASAAAVLAVVAVAILAVAGVELRITREGVRDDAP